ncbi:MAG: KUP/HAK/KT family potassium transporter [Xanthobacteraceae bacterium]
MTPETTKGGAHGAFSASLPIAGLSALGVVFGDIGTSPLYTLKTVLAVTGDRPTESATLGALSLILWTLILVKRASNTSQSRCAWTTTERVASSP